MLGRLSPHGTYERVEYSRRLLHLTAAPGSALGSHLRTRKASRKPNKHNLTETHNTSCAGLRGHSATHRPAAKSTATLRGSGRWKSPGFSEDGLLEVGAEATAALGSAHDAPDRVFAVHAPRPDDLKFAVNDLPRIYKEIRN